MYGDLGIGLIIVFTDYNHRIFGGWPEARIYFYISWANVPFCGQTVVRTHHGMVQPESNFPEFTMVS